MIGMAKDPNAFKQGLAVLLLDSRAPDGLLTRSMGVADREREPAIAKNTAAQWLHCLPEEVLDRGWVKK